MTPQQGNGASSVIDVHNETVVEDRDLRGAARRLLLAGVGAVAIAVDETSAYIDKLAERGKTAESDAQARTRGLRTRIREKRNALLDTNRRNATVTKAVHLVEEGVGELLAHCNIPSRRDVVALNEKLEQVNQKLDALSSQK